jgi:hypothetical protein
MTPSTSSRSSVPRSETTSEPKHPSRLEKKVNTYGSTRRRMRPPKLRRRRSDLKAPLSRRGSLEKAETTTSPQASAEGRALREWAAAQAHSSGSYPSVSRLNVIASALCCDLSRHERRTYVQFTSMPRPEREPSGRGFAGVGSPHSSPPTSLASPLYASRPAACGRPARALRTSRSRPPPEDAGAPASVRCPRAHATRGGEPVPLGVSPRVPKKARPWRATCGGESAWPHRSLRIRDLWLQPRRITVTVAVL